MPINLRSSIPGVGRLAQSLAMGQQAYDQGYDAEATARTKIAQALAQMRQSDAAARHYDAQAAGEQAKTDALGRRPDAFFEQAALLAGTDVPTLQAFRQKLQTGVAPQGPMGPPTEGGDMGVGSVQFEPAVSSALAKHLARVLPMTTSTGDLNPEQLAKAAGAYREQDLADAIIAGTADRNRVGGAQAAIAGKPLFNSDASGGVLDQFTGGYDVSNPMAQGTLTLKGAQTAAQRANATQSLAAAGASNASRDKTRQEIELGTKGQYDSARGILVDPRTGQARDVMSGGKPIGAKDKGLNDAQGKAYLFGTRAQAATTLLDNLASAGVDKPGQIKAAIERVPLIGQALGDAMNKTPAMLGGPNEQQQQVEQAQRDFINAILRRESGAVISDSEFANAARQYFPRVGDLPAVVAQKKANRDRAVRGILAEVPAGFKAPAESGDRNVQVDW